MSTEASSLAEVMMGTSFASPRTVKATLVLVTSLAVLAWLSDPSFTGSVERGVKFLAESCKAGRFGSTQSTVLALKAIVEG